MVLGVGTKNQRNSVRVDYLIHIQEIKPWPPSQSLRSLRSVLIQWENGGRNSGSTNTVAPSIGSAVGEGKIEFNESFKLPVTFLRETSVKGRDNDAFQKNCLELNLYEPRRDKIQLLATAVVDLADYGVVKETISLTAPMNSKRNFSNTSRPVLYIKIQPVDKARTKPSSRNSLSTQMSLDKNGSESVSGLMNEEYAEEAEIASFTDDDESSHSSLTNGGLPQNEENGPDRFSDSKGRVNKEKSASYSSSIDLSSDIVSPVNGPPSVLNSPNIYSMSSPRNDVAQNAHSKTSPFTQEGKGEEANSSMSSNGYQDLSLEVKANANSGHGYHIIEEDNGQAQADQKNFFKEAAAEDMMKKKHQENEEGGQNLDEKSHFSEDEPLDTATTNEGFIESNTVSLTEEIGLKENILKFDWLKPVKSVRSLPESVRSNGQVNRNQHNEVKEASSFADGAGYLRVNDRKNAKVYPKDTRTTFLDSKIQQLEHKMKILKGELREAAAVEAALYSVVAEHGSSMSKVHAPARRLSRLYLHAFGENSKLRRAGAARSAVSGLVLVAKACGNDVPRLTFWLSNSVVLRAIISQAIGDSELRLSSGPHIVRNGDGKGNKKISPLKWNEASPSRKENKTFDCCTLTDWEDPRAFMSALEKVEAWIFSRIVESIWWQTLTPYMQSSATKAIDSYIGSSSKKILGRVPSSGDQDQVNFSLDLWKQAFKDACEKLCPVRAGGHECGCLPMLARLVMEQCVARLDVAMFNAILRESADEIPTDPVSDPISDSKVLPIPAAKSSFGAGAQLKNAIGNWSRWLTDLFGMDDDESFEDDNDKDENNMREDTSFKSFHLLNALSDLMMLPKDMLLSKSMRKEVCPTFGAPLIKRVLDNFISDEFCPDPIPDAVLEALDSEDAFESEETIMTVPYTAAPPMYLPHTAASVARIIGKFGSQPHLIRSGSSMLRKSYTSDDELDELNSPLASIFIDGSWSSPQPTKLSWKSKEYGNQTAIRYELLKEVWMNSE